MAGVFLRGLFSRAGDGYNSHQNGDLTADLARLSTLTLYRRNIGALKCPIISDRLKNRWVLSADLDFLFYNINPA